MTDELALLLEIAAELSKRFPQNDDKRIADGVGDASSEGAEDGIVCDHGPVVVLRDTTAQTKTLGGKSHFWDHPLWKWRFLMTEDRTRAVTFYMNEAFRMASPEPPNPLRSCIGGILADAMGLGKMVMLLSLIMKSKEEEKERPRRGAASLNDKSEPKIVCFSSDDEDKKGKRRRAMTKTSVPAFEGTTTATTLVMMPL